MFLASPAVRSEFLLSTQILCLGEDYDPELHDSGHNFFVLHHEYLHYEQFGSWRSLVLTLAAQTLVTHSTMEWSGATRSISAND